MPTDQVILFGILAALFGLLIWGRWRYDPVAFAMLMLAVVTGANSKLGTPTEGLFRTETRGNIQAARERERRATFPSGR